MTLAELNRIEQVLKGNIEFKRKVRVLCIEVMKEKYCDDYYVQMNATEKEAYDKSISEYNEACDIYKSFTEHNWK